MLGRGGGIKERCFDKVSMQACATRLMTSAKQPIRVFFSLKLRGFRIKLEIHGAIIGCFVSSETEKLISGVV